MEPYRDDHPYMVEMKAAQLGLTTKAMLQAVYGCRYRGYKGVLYLFPGKSDVTDFSQGRISPLIDENPDTIGKWLKDTDCGRHQADLEHLPVSPGDAVPGRVEVHPG